MPDDKPLSDTQVHDRLVAASYVLGSAPGATGRANTALEAARRALRLLQLGMVHAMEAQTDKIPGVIDPDQQDH